MKFQIQTWKNNEILRKKSVIIEKKDFQKFSKIWEDMIKFIKDPKNNWVWLAAPQIGLNYRLICVSLLKSYEDTNFKSIYMINPEIIALSKEKEIDNEWCLSSPWLFGDVERSTNIKVKYQDNKWKEILLNLSWISARIIQHEIDHLDWILFIDKMIKDELNWKML